MTTNPSCCVTYVTNRSKPRAFWTHRRTRHCTVSRYCITKVVYSLCSVIIPRVASGRISKYPTRASPKLAVPSELIAINHMVQSWRQYQQTTRAHSSEANGARSTEEKRFLSQESVNRRRGRSLSLPRKARAHPTNSRKRRPRSQGYPSFQFT